MPARIRAAPDPGQAPSERPGYFFLEGPPCSKLIKMREPPSLSYFVAMAAFPARRGAIGHALSEPKLGYIFLPRPGVEGQWAHKKRRSGWVGPDSNALDVPEWAELALDKREQRQQLLQRMSLR
jgi:hypothetical protein